MSSITPHATANTGGVSLRPPCSIHGGRTNSFLATGGASLNTEGGGGLALREWRIFVQNGYVVDSEPSCAEQALRGSGNGSFDPRWRRISFVGVTTAQDGRRGEGSCSTITSPPCHPTLISTIPKTAPLSFRSPLLHNKPREESRFHPPAVLLHESTPHRDSEPVRRGPRAPGEHDRI